MTDPLSMPDPTGATPVVSTPDAELMEPIVAKPSRHLATQTEYPWRTSIQSGAITAVAVLAAVAGGLSDPTVMVVVNRYVPGQAATILGFGVFCGVVVTALHRIVNIPAVAAALTRLHLGPVPKN